MEKTGFYANIFDLWTIKEMAVVAEALNICRHIIIAVNACPEKEPLFSTEERIKMIKSSFSDFIRLQTFLRQAGVFGEEKSFFRRLYGKLSADPNCISVVPYRGEEILAAINAGADMLIRDSRYEDQIVVSYHNQQIARHYGSPIQQVYYPLERYSGMPDPIRYVTAQKVLSLCSNNLFSLAALYVMPSTMDKLAAKYLYNLWNTEKNIDSDYRYHSLVKRYNAPGRVYHTMSHLAYMVDWLYVYATQEKHGFDQKHLLPGIFMHDLINEGKSDDVKKSVELIGQYCNAACDPKIISRYILATDHEMNEADREKMQLEERLIHDLDLAVLGDSYDVYLQYAAGIREEYIHISEKTYAQRRITVLQMFIERENIFLLPFFRTRMESAARANINREIQMWKQLLTEEKK